MPKCTKCGADIYETSRFCPECGAPVETVKDPEITTELLEKKTENILEDIPEIKKIDSEPETAAQEESAEQPEVTVEQTEIQQETPEEPPVTDDISPTMPEQTKKSSPIGIVIAVIAVAAIAAGVVFSGVLTPQDSTSSSETAVDTSLTVTEISAEETTALANETETSETITESVTEETISVTEAETTVESETFAEFTESSVTGIQSDETTVETPETPVQEAFSGASFTPEHRVAMGSGVSAEIKLSDQGLTADMLTDTLIVADYTVFSEGDFTPVKILITFDDTDAEVIASGSDGSQVIFEFASITAAAENFGYDINDIDSIAFISNGAPVDVTAVSIITI